MLLMAISKSKYLRYKTCPKLLWLYLNKPEEAIEAADAQKHIDDGKARKEFTEIVRVEDRWLKKIAEVLDV